MRDHHNGMANRLLRMAGSASVRCTVWAVIVTAITVGSLMPPDMAAEEIPPMFWEVGHLPAYALLTLVSLWWLQGAPGDRHAGTGLIALGVVAFGIVIELVQPLFGRHADPRDVGANVVGVVLAASFWTLAASPIGRSLASRVQLRSREP